MRQKSAKERKWRTSNRDGKWNDVLRLKRTKTDMEITAKYPIAAWGEKKYWKIVIFNAAYWMDERKNDEVWDGRVEWGASTPFYGLHAKLQCSHSRSQHTLLVIWPHLLLWNRISVLTEIMFKNNKKGQRSILAQASVWLVRMLEVLGSIRSGVRDIYIENAFIFY